ncbi:hypothetical protein F6V30_07575 [Oryzomonas sagensis]|uniref:Lipoprotein n=1 Tax=Oryzomonas sagensis TaxID=2603857 RepID=A0ABQ6TTP2_9BACT|nr:hypothetical protein [Oryzomonas sagensis]KAB0672412.1 hypothetical protein F6V30_07575 [Oryzomonas sagensis]
MKKYVTTTMISVFFALTLAGCGGGGGGGGSVTKATTKAYLFGNMTSTSTVVTIQTTMNVPSGVLVNYSSTPGATTGLCPLRKGVIVPSGPVLASSSDFNLSSYDIGSRVLTISMVNNGRVPLKSSTTANTGTGVEFATINFTLATAGAVPASMPLVDPAPTVGQELPGPILSLLPGSKINFATTYQ